MPAKKMQLPDEVNQEINNGFVKKSVFETLNAINVNDKTEKKQNLTYLSWAWAWAEEPTENRHKLTLEEIRRLHGSTVIKDDEEKKLNPTYKKIRAAI